MGYTDRDIARWIKRAESASARSSKSDSEPSPEAHAMLLLEAFISCAEEGPISPTLVKYFADRFETILDAAPEPLEPPSPDQIADALFLNRPAHRRKEDTSTRDMALAALVARYLNGRPEIKTNRLNTFCETWQRT